MFKMYFKYQKYGIILKEKHVHEIKLIIIECYVNIL